MQGNGNVVVATSDNELTFLSGAGIERCSVALDGDFVSMVAGSEWVFVVQRDGSTTMDGEALRSARALVLLLMIYPRLAELDGHAIRLRRLVRVTEPQAPHTKGPHVEVDWDLRRGCMCFIIYTVHSYSGLAVTKAPAVYDSAGVMYLMPRFRIPLRGTWLRILDTSKLERRQGKDESYWPVGLSEDTFMCLILKGRQEHPSFPRPLIQELPVRLPFRGKDPKDAPLEEQ
jgi:chromosome transmission fidelity protein 4